MFQRPLYDKKSFISYEGIQNLGKKEYKFRTLFPFYNNLLSLPAMKILLDKNPEEFSWLLSILINFNKS